MPTKLKGRSEHYDKRTNKGLLFFSASSSGDTKQLLDFGIREILVSYFYIRKSLSYYDDEALPLLKKDGGVFMTDSGAFSFMAAGETEAMLKEEYWIPYLEEYVEWLKKHKDLIYCAANLDLDKVVGREVVAKWNKKYFEPLEKEGIDIVYVAHEDEDLRDPYGIEHFKGYCKKYKYVGINQSQKKHASRFYQIAKEHNVRVHGFAWTELRIVKVYPFASLDSTTWLGGVRYGATYLDDGKNFQALDMEKKYRRKASRIKYEKRGVIFDNVTKREKRIDINKMNLIGWLGFRREYLKMANLKLHTKTVNNYVRH